MVVWQIFAHQINTLSCAISLYWDFNNIRSTLIRTLWDKTLTNGTQQKKAAINNDSLYIPQQ